MDTTKSGADKPTPDRLHALDAVRGYALLLGVVLHATAAFLPDFPMASWKLESSTVASVLYYVIHLFRMSAFYLIAGFFARMVLERRGVKAFVRDRAKRVLLPLVVGLPVVVLFVVAGLVLGALPHGGDYLSSLTRAPPPEPGSAPAARHRSTASLVSLLPAHLLCSCARHTRHHASSRPPRIDRRSLRPGRRIHHAGSLGARSCSHCPPRSTTGSSSRGRSGLGCRPPRLSFRRWGHSSDTAWRLRLAGCFTVRYRPCWPCVTAGWSILPSRYR